MKIDLAYPKIPDALNCPLKQCVAFEKLDGTNVHFVWWRDHCFVGYGTRRDRFDLTSPDGIRQFEKAHPELKGIDLLWDQDCRMEEYLLRHPKYGQSDMIVFTEYHGPNSFAGSHKPKDKMQLTIIDVMVDDKMLPPEELLEDFKDFNLPRVIFKGKFSGQLFVDVRNGKYDVKEGVVVKGVVDGKVHMAKIKTQAYLDKLKEHFGDKWKEYGE
jgi:hypothetical protein